MSLRQRLPAMRPVGLMDKASASGAGDSRLESWAGHFFKQRCVHAPPAQHAVEYGTSPNVHPTTFVQNAAC